MTTIVPGLVKIGKTGLKNFEQRMYHLEHNGYVNVVGLKRRFAIEVDDYDEKESLLHDIFSKSNIPNTELFAIDEDLVVQLLSSFEGEQIFPKSITKEEVFDTAADERNNTNSTTNYQIPEGDYFYNGKAKGFGTISAAMEYKNGSFIVKKGSQCLPLSPNLDWHPDVRKNAIIENGVLQKDVECKSPSYAGWVVLGRHNNGWKTWKTQDGKPIDIFRKTK